VGRRLGIGFVKGLVLGALIGAGITFGLRWPTPSGGVLAYLLALGVGGTTGIFAGKAPWKEGAWLEAVLKGVVGVMATALLYWLASSYASFALPWPGASAPVAWTALPPIYLGLVGAIYGALVELDYDDADTKKAPAKKTPAEAAPAPKARVPAIDDTEAAAETKAPLRKRI
jgi:hypothetical protein